MNERHKVGTMLDLHVARLLPGGGNPAGGSELEECLPEDEKGDRGGNQLEVV